MKDRSLKYQAGMGLPYQNVVIGTFSSLGQCRRELHQARELEQTGLGKET